MGTYYQITNEEMSTFLSAKGFNRIQIPGTYEDVYAYDVKSKPGLQIRVYSSISSRGEARKVGADAIRVTLFSVTHSKPVGSESRVYRTTGWEKNLGTRLKETMEQVVALPVCECGAWMVERESRFGKFLGCVRYPDCKKTVSVRKTA
jgi:hypothetical protein